MEKIAEIINRKKLLSNVNNDNSNIHINVNNVDSPKAGKYAFDKSKISLNTPETLLAYNIASSFGDLSNFAFYLSVVNKLGEQHAHAFWKSILLEIEGKRNTRFRIENPKRYFAWKYKRGLVY